MEVRGHLALLLVFTLAIPQQTVGLQSGLKVRVRQGQDAVNDTRARTAVSAVVEVRDDGDQPVAGATVTFELPGAGPGGSFHGWMRAQTVRTDAEGVAEASGFAPNAETGRFEIQVTAVSDDRMGMASVAQTNGPAAPRAQSAGRKPPSRKARLIVSGAATGLMIATTALVLRRNQSSKYQWWGAAVAVGSLLGFISLLMKRPPSANERFESANGRVEITPIHHAALRIRGGGLVIYVDPTGEIEYAGQPRADLVLITDAYSDHFDPAVLPQLLKSSAVVYGPEAAARSSPLVTAMRNGETRALGGWEISALPAYNLPPDETPGRVFHEKGEGNGYLLAFGGKRFYISGNTGNTPEMRALRDVDAAFLCMNPPYTMSDADAAEAVRAFRPKVVYPYHYRGNLLGVFRFKTAFAGTRTEIRVRNWYR